MDTNSPDLKKKAAVKETSGKRSNAYPSSTILKSLEIAELVYKNAGNSYLSGEQIATLLKKSFNTITQKLSSCVQYGLLELKPKVGYKPAAICKQIFKPFSEDERKQALVSCFRKPKLYVELIAKYENASLPSARILPNILDRDHNVFDDAAEKAAEIFFENLKDLDLITNENELSFEPTKPGHKEEMSPELLETDEGQEFELIEAAQPNKLDRKAEQIIDVTNLSQLYKTDIPLTDGKKAILFYPSDLNANDLKLLKGQIDFLGLYIQLNRGEAKNE